MIREIFDKLLYSFGPQGWWPLTEKGEVKPEHNGKNPVSDNEKFEIVTGAILTQNTNWKNVEKAIINLNKNRLIDIKKIKNIDKDKLAGIIKPSGYYNQKAERLKLIAEFFDKNINKFLIKNNNKKIINKLRGSLLSIKGIGPETADSILLYAFEKPIFVVDAYTKRIMQRLGLKFKGYDDLQGIFMDNTEKNAKIYNEYHALLVELGKNYCKNKNPNCKECPLRNLCKND